MTTLLLLSNNLTDEDVEMASYKSIGYCIGTLFFRSNHFVSKIVVLHYALGGKFLYDWKAELSVGVIVRVLNSSDQNTGNGGGLNDRYFENIFALRPAPYSYE